MKQHFKGLPDHFEKCRFNHRYVQTKVATTVSLSHTSYLFSSALCNPILLLSHDLFIEKLIDSLKKEINDLGQPHFTYYVRTNQACGTVQ